MRQLELDNEKIFKGEQKFIYLFVENVPFQRYFIRIDLLSHVHFGKLIFRQMSAQKND